MIRKAKLKDLRSICIVVKEAVKVMNYSGNFQWDEYYPIESDFEKDINDGTLYVSVIDNEIAGVICLTFEEGQEYKNVKWRLDSKAINIHRLVVGIKHRGKGIARSLFEHADKIALETNALYIKGDTHQVNDLVNELFIKYGYTYVGDMNINYIDGNFKCYDKIIK